MYQALFLFAVLLAQVSESESQRAIDLAKDTLSAKVGVSRADIQVVRAEAVDWGDSSLGCPSELPDPEPRSMPGYRILLRANEETYRVHVGGGQAVVCGSALRLEKAPQVGEIKEGPSMKPRVPSHLTPNMEKLVRQAKEDLAGRLSVEVQQIMVTYIMELMWPDSSLGCPEPDMMYSQVLQEGCLIRLRVGDKTYDYHSSAKGSPFHCEKSKQRLPKIPIVNNK